ncbi:MAG: VWA domain-containing protein [Anaerolineaceae bacterium]|nr:VWA domain-containing protein [Anaerolineaceae bacterium]
MPKSKLKYSIIYGSDKLLIMNEPQVYYALIALNAEGEKGQSSQIPKNLCFVVDASTSMQGEPIDIVKQSLSGIPKMLDDQDTLSIVTFNDRAETIFRPTRVNKIQSISRYIAKIRAVGGTEMYQGLKRGYIQLLRTKTFRQSLSTIILLTDGQTYGDEDMCFRLIKNARSDGINIFGVGIGNEWNDEFLDELVGYAGGTSTYLSEIHKLPTVLSNLIKMTHADSIPQLTMKFETNSNVTLSNIFRLEREVSLLPVYNNQVCVGSVPFGSNIQLLLEFHIPPLNTGEGEICLLNGKFINNSHKEHLKIQSNSINLKVPLSSTPEKDIVVSSKIMQAVFTISLYRMQEAARNEIRKGEINKGIRMLRNLANQLKVQGKPALASRIIEEVLFIENYQGYSTSGEKQIKYATRILSAETQIAMSNMKTKKVELK